MLRRQLFGLAVRATRSMRQRKSWRAQMFSTSCVFIITPSPGTGAPRNHPHDTMLAHQPIATLPPVTSPYLGEYPPLAVGECEAQAIVRRVGAVVSDMEKVVDEIIRLR